MDKKVQTILECMRCPILVLSSKLSIIEINDAALKSYGWVRENIMEKNMFDLCRETNVVPPVSLESLNVALVLSNTGIYINEKKHKGEWEVVCSDKFIPGEKNFIVSKQGANGILQHIWRDSYQVLLARSMALLIEQMATMAKNHIMKEVPIDFNQRFFSKDMLFDKIFNVLPGEVYWEDRNLNYLGCNDYCAEVIGLHCSNDIISKDDMFIKKVMGSNYPDDAYGLWRKTALMAMEKKAALINMQDLTYKHPDTGEEIKSMTSKIPIVNSAGESIGMVGISINQNDPEHLKQVVKASDILKEIGIRDLRIETVESLSTKEFECVASRAKGMTIKQIASTLSLSPRTVETYLNRAKNKTQSCTTEKIVDLYWQYINRNHGVFQQIKDAPFYERKNELC